VFFSYAHRDETLRDELAKHLSHLQNQKVIAGWHDRQIPAGTEWAGAIDAHLENAQIILLLISADFMASQYCYGIEMQRAMDRHEAGQARVIPIIVRAVDWKSAPFGRLQALPKDGLAVTSWANPDEAFADIARGIRSIAEELVPKPLITPPVGTRSVGRGQPTSLPQVAEDTARTQLEQASAPYAPEERAELRAHRRKLIESWRTAVEAEEYDFIDYQSTFLASAVYSSLRPHLSSEVVRKVEAPRTVYVGGARGDFVRHYMLLDEVARLERLWGLV
jgi:hypothetical protein